jgi:hypothetical protein
MSIATLLSEALLTEKGPTFAAARNAVLDKLQKDGWKLSDRSLKIPHATSPDGQVRLWFKSQAVYYTFGNAHSMNGARSLHSDLRTMSPEDFVKDAEKFARKEDIDQLGFDAIHEGLGIDDDLSEGFDYWYGAAPLDEDYEPAAEPEDEWAQDKAGVEVLNQKLTKTKKGHGWWKPPHNLLVNQALMGINLWRFRLFSGYGGIARAFRKDKNALIIKPGWSSVDDGRRIGSMNASGFTQIDPETAEKLVKLVAAQPTIEDTVREELAAIEKQFGIEIPSNVKAGLIGSAVKVAGQKWGLSSSTRGKDRAVPLDGSKPYDLGAFESDERRGPGLHEAQQTDAALAFPGEDEQAKPGGFKISSKALGLFKKELGADWQPEQALFKRQRQIIDDLSQEELAELFGAERIDLAQDAIAGNPRKAFNKWLMMTAKVSPKLGKTVRAVPENASLLFYLTVVRVSGRDMADIILKRYFETESDHIGAVKSRMKVEALEEAIIEARLAGSDDIEEAIEEYDNIVKTMRNRVAYMKSGKGDEDWLRKAVLDEVRRMEQQSKILRRLLERE